MITHLINQIKQNKVYIKNIDNRYRYENNSSDDDKGITKETFVRYAISKYYAIEINITKYYWTNESHIQIWIVEQNEDIMVYDGSVRFDY